MDSFVNGLETLLHNHAIREVETARVMGTKQTEDWETYNTEANGLGKAGGRTPKSKGKDGQKGKGERVLERVAKVRNPTRENPIHPIPQIKMEF
eukprot:1009671-Amphidinium_carterae.1